MLTTYAFAPHLFDPKETSEPIRILLYQMLRDIQDGGLIANLNQNDWYGTLHSLRPRGAGAEQDLWLGRTLTLLNAINQSGRLIPCPPHSADGVKTPVYWAQAAHAAQAARPFHHMFVPKASERAARTILECACGIDEEWFSDNWSVARCLRTERSVARYEELLGPTLRSATYLHIIDPYIVPDVGRFRKFLDLCVWLIARRYRPGDEFHLTIHTSTKNWNQGQGPQETRCTNSHESKIAWTAFMEDAQRRDPSLCVKVHVWNAQVGDDDFHDRFLITNHCGIAVQRGLEINEDEARQVFTVWSLLDHASRQAIEQTFSPEMQFHGPRLSLPEPGGRRPSTRGW